MKVWGNVVTVEWADPIEDPDPEVMAKVRDDRQYAVFVSFNKYLKLVSHLTGQGAVCEELGEHCYRRDT